MPRERLGPDSKLNVLEDIFRRTVSVEASLDDIPEPTPCTGCGNPTFKAFVDYEWDWRSCNNREGEVSVIFGKRLPGYCCGGCATEYYDARLSDLFLEQVAEALSEMGDDFLKEELRRDSADPRTHTAFPPIPPQAKERLRRLSAALTLEDPES